MDTKFIGLSKTMWLNIITLIVTIGGLIVQQPWLTVHTIAIIASVVAVLNIILRWLRGDLTLTAPTVPPVTPVVK